MLELGRSVRSEFSSSMCSFIVSTLALKFLQSDLTLQRIGNLKLQGRLDTSALQGARGTPLFLFDEVVKDSIDCIDMGPYTIGLLVGLGT